MAFGRKVRLTLKNRHIKFYDLISKIHEKNPKKHTPPQKKKTFFFGGGVGSEMNKTRQHRRGVFAVKKKLSKRKKDNRCQSCFPLLDFNITFFVTLLATMAIEIKKFRLNFTLKLV